MSPHDRGDDRHRDESEDPAHYAEEHPDLAKVHRSVHRAAANADPTDQQGRPLLVAGFIALLVLVLVVMLVIGIWLN